MSDTVFLFPGQGSQHVGMGKALFEERASVRRLFEEASDITGTDLRRLCFEGPEAVLVQTDNVQPAITLVNLACFRALVEDGITPVAAAGHSLGEYAALCAAGVFTVAETLRLVRIRGEAMKRAAERHPGGMAAVFGLDIDTLSAVCAEVSPVGAVGIANHNSPLQIALTGETTALREAGVLAKQRGAKLVVPLKVSGAWHSRFMADAQEPLREALAQCRPAAPRVPVISNVTAEAHGKDPAAICERLVEQLVRPVRWFASMRRLIEEGGGVFVEAGPGKVLAGLMRDISREVKVLTAAEIERLADSRATTGS
jgi:[acyl-carrier-protein] S-malonyltransferase